MTGDGTENHTDCGVQMATFQTYMELPCVECLRLLETRISKAVSQKERSAGNKRQASLSVSAQCVLTNTDCSHELRQVRSCTLAIAQHRISRLALYCDCVSMHRSATEAAAVASFDHAVLKRLSQQPRSISSEVTAHRAF